MTGDYLMVEGKPFYLRGGEFQYFRLNRKKWRKRLIQAIDGGLNTISIPIPWCHHETEEGRFDFTGQTSPQRDLNAFLDMVTNVGLKMIVKPGPYIGCGFRLGGFPEWMVTDYPQTTSRGADGSFQTRSLVPAEGEPFYREFVRKWLRAVIGVLAGHQIDQGGGAILLQIDHQTAGTMENFVDSLHDPATLNTHWPKFLERKYGSIDEYNARFNTKASEFSEIRAPLGLDETDATRRWIDWLHFKRRFYSEWWIQLARWCREFGWTAPFIFNEPLKGYFPHGVPAEFGTVLRQSKLQGVIACEVHADRVMDLRGVIEPAIALELLKSNPAPGPAINVDVGINGPTARSNLSEINWEILLRLGVAQGLKGTVLGPYAAVKADPRLVFHGPEFHEPACLSIAGESSGGYYQTKRFFKFINAWDEGLLNSQTLTDAAIAYAPGPRVPDLLDARRRLDGLADAKNVSSAKPIRMWEQINDLTMLLKRLNISAGLLDVTNPNLRAERKWLFVPCSGIMEREGVEFILDHLTAGGGCLFHPTIPTRHPDGTADSRLADKLDVELLDELRFDDDHPWNQRSRFIEFPGEGGEFHFEGTVFEHRFSKSAETLATCRGKPVAATSLDGKAIVVGFNAEFSSLGSLRFWRTMIEKFMNINPVLRSEGTYYHALLRKGLDTSFLFVMNVVGATGKSEIFFDDPIFPGEKARLKIDMKPHEARCLIINGSIDGRRLLYTSSEVIPGANGELELHGAPGTQGRVVFPRPIQAKLDGFVVKSSERNGFHVLKYVHAANPRILEFS